MIDNSQRCGSSLRSDGPERGLALVVALAMLVLVAGVVTAYFSRALQEGRSSSTSLGGREAEWLSASVTEIILGDFLGEMEAGSEVVETDGGRVFRPRQVASGDSPPVLLTPGIAPQWPVELDSLPNLVKVSRGGLPFYESGTGYAGGDGPARASDVSTLVPALNQRFIQREDWNRPRLMTDAEYEGVDGEDGFTPPDWVYLDREGKTPDAGQTNLEDMADANPDNPDFVLGRFAYVVYDVGGLLDVNVVSNNLPDTENRHRGRLHQVSLAGGLGLSENGALAEFEEFVADWRWPGWAAMPVEEAMEELFDSRRSFMGIEDGHQGFVNRTDLLTYVEEGGVGIPAEALPFLTVYSRALDVPHWRPDPNYWDEPFWADVGVDVVPEEFNPDLALVRFEASTTLERGADPELEVPAGTPVMPRRFPLAKLDLFNVEEADWTSQHEADLLYYFGLERATEPDAEPDVFRYVRAEFTDAGPRIARLSEVAEQGREPNFFEVLRAVILAGSLGITAGQTMTWDMPRDHSGDLHVLQIGANVIDQWDTDDIPTTLQFPEGGGDPWGDPLEVYGMENLPYINQFTMVPHRPVYEPDLFQVWAVFDVWNPHQNATSSPDVNGFRAVPLQGMYDHLWLHYQVSNAPEVRRWREVSNFNFISPGDPITELNQGFAEFPASADYSEVVTIANGAQPPEQEGAVRGVLVRLHDTGEQIDETIEPRANPGVGVFGFEVNDQWRKRDMQINLNELYDHDGGGYSPYIASANYTDHPSGMREYPPGTTFEGLDLDWWAVDPPLAPLDPANPGGTQVATDTTLIYARYAIKDHNSIRAIRPSMSAGGQGIIDGQYDPSWSPDDIPPSFALQVNTGRGWKTYQRVDAWFRRSAGLNLTRNVKSYTGSGSYARQSVTHHLQADVDDIMEDNSLTWYHWRSFHNFMRMDPRGHRFGFTEARDRDFGTSIRSATHTGSSAWQRFRRGIIVNSYPGWSEMGFQIATHTPSSHFHGAGFMTNSPDPDAPNERHPARYRDRDGVVRPGDAYFGDGTEVVPSAPGRYADRPIILNRPFRSEADLGYVFRDLPWKSLDFASRWSADLGLLDVFSLNEVGEAQPLVAGRVSLNTRRMEVLGAVLRGSAERLADVSDQVASREMNDTLAAQLAEGVVEASRESPFAYPGELVPRVLHRSNGGDLLAGLVHKGDREAAIRSLTAIGQTRTWNFMIDLVVQSGRFTARSETAADFLVAGERRFWVHVAMDRITGEVLDIQAEPVFP